MIRYKFIYQGQNDGGISEDKKKVTRKNILRKR